MRRDYGWDGPAPCNCLKVLLFFFSAVLVLSSLAAASGNCTATPHVTRLACASHEVAFDLAQFGQIVGLRTTAGTELGVALDRCKSGFENRPELFELEVRSTNDFTVLKHVCPHHAKQVACTRDGAGLKLTYADFGDEPIKTVTCAVRPDGEKLRWRIAAEPASGWAVTLAAYPLVAVTPRLGADGADDTLVSGHSFRAGLVRNPGLRKWKRYGRQPGALGAQLACYCDPKVLFLYCAEDGAGEAKSLKIESVPEIPWVTEDGIDMDWITVDLPKLSND